MAEKELRQSNKPARRGAAREARPEKEFDERVIQIDRVTRVVKGGRRLRFRATVVVGDRNGKVGVGVAKGAAVVLAITKAIAKAKKNMTEVNLYNSTIPHEVNRVYCGAKVFLKPASPGTGVIAGGAVRAVVEAAGVKDILSKMLGSTNKINNVYATFEALKSLSKREAPVKKEAKEVKTTKEKVKNSEEETKADKKKVSKTGVKAKTEEKSKAGKAKDLKEEKPVEKKAAEKTKAKEDK